MKLQDLMANRVVIFDGALGTAVAHLGGRCAEELNFSHPEAIQKVHQDFIKVGSDIIETNTFNANRISLAEYQLENQVETINQTAVQIAKRAAANSRREILISGSVGPTNKLPTLGQITFDELFAAYREQITVLIKAGVDQIQIETCQDLLQLKIAVIAANQVFKEQQRRIPIIVTVTVDATGRMLLGTEMDAVLATLIPLQVDIIGLNCGVGPEGMIEALHVLAHKSPLPILVQPNAGFPEIIDGKTKYNLNASAFAKWMQTYVTEFGVAMVGGCCGTNTEHLSATVAAVKELHPRSRQVTWQPSLASLFNAMVIRNQPAPLIIGERMNINGSKQFREAMLADNFEAAAELAVLQEQQGSHVLDLSVAYTGRSETSDFSEILSRIVNRTRLPIAADSTNVAALEAALKLIPGRPIINSINLEDGGAKARAILELANRFGAAVIALTIDEQGMAHEVQHKFAIAKKLIALGQEYGIDPTNIFIDLLTFTLAEPKSAANGAGQKTLATIRQLKRQYPNVNTILGVSNISYGFSKHARRVLNSVFLHEAVKVGLDAAIIHASKIVPLSKIDPQTLAITQDLIFNRKANALEIFVQHFQQQTLTSVEHDDKSVSAEDGIRLAILRGDRSRVENYLSELIDRMSAKQILDQILLVAMDKVGRMFDDGEIPLPFVLQSAEVMKKATDWLAPHFKHEHRACKGKVLLATVKGDVHDIGKNLVHIVLENNGYQVIDLGVKQPIASIYQAAIDHQVDVIGLSGLLVESALIMKDDLTELARHKFSIPVVCGGAALTKRYIENELAPVYGGKVYYAKDAFDGLKAIDKITQVIKH